MLWLAQRRFKDHGTTMRNYFSLCTCPDPHVIKHVTGSVGGLFDQAARLRNGLFSGVVACRPDPVSPYWPVPW